jgi:histidyl-tRNA synthetase
MFSGKDVPAVGVSIGIERVFAILEARLRAEADSGGAPIRAAETAVLVASIGGGMQVPCVFVCVLCVLVCVLSLVCVCVTSWCVLMWGAGGWLS